MMRRLIGPVVLLLACNNPSALAPPPDVTLAPASQWSGGEIQLTSAAFSAARLPVIVAGAETLTVRRLSDSVVAALLPSGPSGTLLLELVRGRVRSELGRVSRIGFRKTTIIADWLSAQLITTYRGGTPLVVGNRGLTGQAEILDLGSMTSTIVPGIRGSEPYGLSPTPRADEFIALDSSFLPHVYRLWPPQLVSTPPPQVTGGFIRHLAQLSDSVWLRTGSHATVTYRGADTVQGVRSIQNESPWSIYLSPRGDRATYSVAYSPLGVPVFNSLTGDTAFTLGANLHSAQAAGFSSDGERLYFLGGFSSPDSVLAVQATTGELLAAIKLPYGYGFNLAVDPFAPFVYVETLVDGRPTVLIYDPDLQLVASLAPPLDTPTCSSTCPEGAIAVDRTRNRLHVVWQTAAFGTTTVGGSFVWTYDLLPEP